MTDTPLYRAARALMKSQSGADDFDALDDEMQTGLLDDVRAVLRAVRDPNDLWGNQLPSGYKPGSHSATQIWHSWIDAAIAER